MKEIKLTETQEKAYKKIQNYIKLAKECETYEEYYIRQHTDDFKYRSDYEKIVEYEKEYFKKHEEELKNSYLKYWVNARENNIALTSCSSSTLRALEKKRLIKIIEDGRKYIDKVQLL